MRASCCKIPVEALKVTLVGGLPMATSLSRALRADIDFFATFL
jgi:hypothetical protein